MRKRHKTINAESKKNTGMISMSAPVTIAAAEGDKKGPRKFDTTFYTGGTLEVEGYDRPVVVDLAGLNKGNVLVANLDHVKSQRVGNFDVENDLKTLKAHGTASAATPARDEVVASADDGYVWQSSIEARPTKLEAVNAGKLVTVNGQTFKGPIYVARTSTLKGFAFVSHGADDNTTVTIAAAAASTKELNMDKKLQAWIEAMLPGIDVATLGEEAVENLAAQYQGTLKKTPTTKTKVSDVIAKAKEEDERREKIADITAQAIADNPGRDSEFIDRLQLLADKAIEANWTAEKFDVEVLRAARPQAHTTRGGRGDALLNNRVIEAAICQAGRLTDYEKKFDDQTLQTAHDKFKTGIGLKQLFLMGAEANGYRGSYASDVNIEVQRAAFGMTGPRQIQGASFSTLVVPTIISNTANLFLRDGWNAIDMTPLRIASVRSVRNFQEITTASLTGDLQYEKLGAAGEIKHGTLGELTYTNKADTYAKMLAITRQDIINDDLGALTQVPRRLGRGAALKLNDIFWTEFLVLVSASFFATGNSNINEGVADMTIGGLSASETIFMNQTDPDGKPLGIMPKIIVVPTALKAKALALVDPTGLLITGATSATIPDVNVFKGRFRVESSPYISNTSYTGATSQGWWMLADPSDLPVIEIVALNGRVEPVVETADADFNVLGVQMRGYSDVGVKRQEKRAGVWNDGNAS